MTEVKYNRLGKGYSKSRKADPRLTKKLMELLDLKPGRRILDVGTGSANYAYELARKGYRVWGLDPSQLMLEQANPHPNLSLVCSWAECIPYPDDCFDGVISVLSHHHFSRPDWAHREIHRVLAPGGKALLLVADPRLLDKDSWIAQYFAPVIEEALPKYTPLEKITKRLKKLFHNVSTSPHLLDRDCQDGYFCSAWSRPERYLDPEFTQGISAFHENVQAEESLRKLDMDLANGSFLGQYDSQIRGSQFQGGYYWITAKKAP